MIVFVDIVFREDMVDPIYKQVGLDMNADEVEIVERGAINLKEVVGCSQHYEMTDVYLNGGHTLTIDMEFDEFIQLWKAI